MTQTHDFTEGLLSSKFRDRTSLNPRHLKIFDDTVKPKDRDPTLSSVKQIGDNKEYKKPVARILDLRTFSLQKCMDAFDNLNINQISVDIKNYSNRVVNMSAKNPNKGFVNVPYNHIFVIIQAKKNGNIQNNMCLYVIIIGACFGVEYTSSPPSTQAVQAKLQNDAFFDKYITKMSFSTVSKKLHYLNKNRNFENDIFSVIKLDI